MNQYMVNILPTTQACATPIHYCETSFPQMITCENLPPCGLQKKKET